MSKSLHNSRQTFRDFPHKYNSFPCRLCKRPHPLRICRKFLSMKVTERVKAVRNNKYCSNCLAHDHSQGTCFSKHGCKHCHKFHHTLLHIHPKLLKELGPSPSRSKSKSPVPSTIIKRNDAYANTRKDNVSSKPSLTSILRQNTLVLLPTVLVKIASTTSHARCLLDSGSPVSRVAKSLIEKLHFTTFSLQEETICQSSSRGMIQRLQLRVRLELTIEFLFERLLNHCPNLIRKIFLIYFLRILTFMSQIALTSL